MKKQVIYFFLAFTMISSTSYLLYNLIAPSSFTMNISNIISSLLLFLFSLIFVVVGFKITREKKTIFIPLASLLLISFIAFNLMSDIGIIKLNNDKTVNNFVNKNISEVLKWASSNNIEITQRYEHSDIFPEFYVISQNVNEGTSLKQVESFEVVISSGPNYDKSVIVPNMIGWTVDEVLQFIQDNYLINVEIDFQFSAESRDIVIEQDKNGDLRRKEPIAIIFSLGNEEDLEPVEIIDFKNKSLLETTIWLKRHGLKYQLVYEFEEKIKRHFIITQNKDVGEILTPMIDNDFILTVSKGPEIEVPNLIDMNIENIIKWVSDNNLKINFSDRYDEKTAIGKIIEINYKKGDIIEEGTLIHIVTSNGQLKMPNLNTLYEFREWGTKYGIAIEETNEFSDSVTRGNIIKMSHNINDTISNNDKIIITISQGKAITVPSFIGKTKVQATSLCNSAGLKCSFKEGNYSSTVNKDNVTSQSRNSGAIVVQNSSITLTVSKGSPSLFDFAISELWYYPLKSADGTISDLKKEFGVRYKDVNFTFIKKDHNTLAPGMIHPDSPTNNGSPQKVEQGKTYTLWIVQ